MQILMITWSPNAVWAVLSEAEQRDYLRSLDGYINAGRSQGMVVLGWSAIDQTLPKASKDGFVGVFGVESAAQVHELEKLVGEARWYQYFDSTNISINLTGSTEAEPHKVYAGLLGIALD